MSEAKERPIIFSAPMVRAILEGRKTQTRRVIKCDTGQYTGKLANPSTGNLLYRDGSAWAGDFSKPISKCPYGQPGDSLWVRETWREFDDLQTKQLVNGVFVPVGDASPGGIGYRADTDHCGQVPVGDVLRTVKDNWHSPIYMPRWASRITLEITDVRVERVREISDADAGAEGGFNVCGFSVLWDDINAKRGYSWESNPWVWVIEFRNISGVGLRASQQPHAVDLASAPLRPNH